MTEQGAHDRQSFEAQGSAFLKQNISEKPEFDYAENRPPRSFALAGKTLTLALRDADVRYRHTFGRDEVTIEVMGPEAERRPITTSYEAFEMASEVFFLSYLVDDLDSVAMALDLAKGVATVVMGEMMEDGIISRVGSSRVEEIASAGEPAYHPRYSLGGTRFLNTYAHNVAYEHIYLTGVYETWMGVRGPQAGQADTEEYHSFKIADGVYLLYWNEGVLTAQMTFLFNFFAGNCVAELYARVEGDVVHNTIGANTMLIHTKLPELPDVIRVDVYSGD
jgi:MoaF C-terminal domain/MoaF N-terminal domain